MFLYGHLGNTRKRCNHHVVTSVEQRKNLSPRQESNLCFTMVTWWLHLSLPPFIIYHLRNMFFLLYRYWRNTRIFPFTKKSYLHRAQWRYHFYLSRVRILVSPWLLYYTLCCYRIFLFFIRILTFWNRKYKYYCLYFCFISLYPSFITFLWQAFCDRWPL